MLPTKLLLKRQSDFEHYHMKVAIAAPPAVTPAPTPIPKPARPTPAKRERPTDGQIITVLAEHFHVSFSEAASWINSAEIFA